MCNSSEKLVVAFNKFLSFCTNWMVPLSALNTQITTNQIFFNRPHYELIDFCDSHDPMDMMYNGGGSPGYFSSSTPPQHTKGRPRKKRVIAEEDTACGEMPVTMRMAAATLGKFN